MEKAENQSLTPKGNVLIVDDNLLNLQVLGKILRENKYDVSESSNGLDAIEKAKIILPDLILLDIVMPGMDGFETCIRLRTYSLLKNIPVIFLTARDDKESIMKGFELGAQDYIKKPYQNHELLARVETHISLKKRSEELHQLNQKLEQIIKKRTIQLEESNQKLEQLNKQLTDFNAAKARFLDLISHEIRTPLHGILGFTSILNKKLHSTEYSIYVNQLKQSADRLESFSKKALLITQLHTRLTQIEPSKIKLIDLITKVVDKYSAKLQNRNINPEISVIPEDLAFRADEYLFEKCLGDILDNAIKYSYQDSKIIIKANGKRDKIRMEIEDFGTGFTREAKNSLFQLFAIGDDHMNLNWGLGLALVKQIIDIHGGKIRVITNEGKGTKVLLFLKK